MTPLTQQCGVPFMASPTASYFPTRMHTHNVTALPLCANESTGEGRGRLCYVGM